MDNQFGRVVSLGPLCTSKHQMRRVPIERQGLGIGRRGKTVVPGSPSAVFDWQITPLPVLFDYLRRDFAGMFEHDDLTL